MATLEWGDTFDHYNWANTAITQFGNHPIGKKWTGCESDDVAWLVSATFARPGSGGGNGLRTTTRYIYKTLPGGALATRMVAFWWNPKTSHNTNAAIVTAFLDVTTEQLSLRTDAGAHLLVSRAGTTLATSTNTLSQNTWYWIEFKATINNTTGAYEVRVNGTATGWIAAATNQNTRGTGTNNSATGIRIGGSNVTEWWYDDVIVVDDFTGQMQGTFVPAIGPGNYSQWTPNSGSNDGAIRAAAPDDDNSFNSSTTSGNIDTFTMAKLPVSGTPTILAIQHVIYAKQDAGVQRTIRPKQRTSSVNYNGTSVNTGSSYAFYTEVKATDPSTSAAWTKSGFESAEFGYENV